MDTSRRQSRRTLAAPFSRLSRVALLLICFIPNLAGVADAAESPCALARLQVEYSDTPLGIDVERPRFSWQMRAPEGERG